MKQINLTAPDAVSAGCEEYSRMYLELNRITRSTGRALQKAASASSRSLMELSESLEYLGGVLNDVLCRIEEEGEYGRYLEDCMSEFDQQSQETIGELKACITALAEEVSRCGGSMSPPVRSTVEQIKEEKELLEDPFWMMDFGSCDGGEELPF